MAKHHARLKKNCHWLQGRWSWWRRGYAWNGRLWASRMAVVLVRFTRDRENQRITFVYIFYASRVLFWIFVTRATPLGFFFLMSIRPLPKAWGNSNLHPSGPPPTPPPHLLAHHPHPAANSLNKVCIVENCLFIFLKLAMSNSRFVYTFNPAVSYQFVIPL